MMTVFRGMPLDFDILLWLFIEGFLATQRAEIIRLSHLIGLSCGCLWINFHTAHQVFDHKSHILS